MAYGDKTYARDDDRDEPELITMTIKYDVNTGSIELQMTGEPTDIEAIGILQLAQHEVIAADRG